MSYVSKRSLKRNQMKNLKMNKEEFSKYEKIASNVVIIGKCGKCGSPLFYYADSAKENIFNYYCSQCNHTDDVRFPSKDDKFIENENPLEIVEKILNGKGIKVTDEDLKQDVSKTVLNSYK